MVDLTPVKLQWQSERKKFSCLEIEIEWRGGDDGEARSSAGRCTAIQEDYTRADPTMRVLLGMIFVDILGYLYQTGEASLANSI